MNSEIMNAYLKHEAERKEMGIPALPLNSVQATELCKLLENPEKGQEDFLMNLFTQRISPGVDPAAEIKANFLGKILDNSVSCPFINKYKAIEILATMIGGYNVKYLIETLKDSDLADKAANALSGITLVYDAFDEALELSKTNNAAKKVIQSWADAEWFTSRPEFPKEITVKAYKVDGETNTDDFSPASDASTRSDIPLHSLSLGQTGFTDGIETIAEWRKQGHKVAFMGDVVGTGSSRKSATNSVFWHTGEDINYVPNKKRDAVVIGGVIAPIFFNTVEDSGGLPITCDVTNIKRGDIITINTEKGEITNEAGEVVTTFELKPNTIADEYRAGGRIALIIGRSLTEKARTALGLGETDIFEKPIQ